MMQGRKLRGRKQVRRKDGSVVDCRYWALRTTVAKLPYFILLLWLTRPREILSPAA